MRRTHTRYEPPPLAASERPSILMVVLAVTLIGAFTALTAQQLGWLPDWAFGPGVVRIDEQCTPLPTLPPTMPYQPGSGTSGGATYGTSGGATYGTNSLPSCADVTDTRTACQAAPAAVEQPQALPTEPPAPTATEPPYMAACWTEPVQRPCWLPADASWTPPADVPSTPIVLVEEEWHAPMALPADVCAEWHPPAPYPEECGDE